MYSLVDKMKRVCFKTKRGLHSSIYIKCSGGIEAVHSLLNLNKDPAWPFWSHFYCKSQILLFRNKWNFQFKFKLKFNFKDKFKFIRHNVIGLGWIRN